MVKTVDALIVGAGVFGLAAAERLTAAGLSVCVIDAAHVGAGSSGGVLGALTAHAPDPWNPKKAFQRDALLALEPHCQALESETGLSTGYGRIGRITPFATAGAREFADLRAPAAIERWGGHTAETYDGPPPGVAPSAAPYGYSFDTFAARLNPMGYLQALAAAAQLRGAEILENTAFLGRDPATGVVQTSAGSMIAGALILAHGWRSYADAAQIGDSPAIGRAEKGQATLLHPAQPYDGPLIYGPGLYITPHADGTIAVGGAADKTADDDTPNLPLDYLDAARTLCPWLETAQVVRHWAGARPRCFKPDPVIGSVAPGVWLISGGYKIGFGVAHRLAQVLTARVTGAQDGPTVPPTFEIDAHIALQTNAN